MAVFETHCAQYDNLKMGTEIPNHPDHHRGRSAGLHLSCLFTMSYRHTNATFAARQSQNQASKSCFPASDTGPKRPFVTANFSGKYSKSILNRSMRPMFKPRIRAQSKHITDVSASRVQSQSRPDRQHALTRINAKGPHSAAPSIFRSAEGSSGLFLLPIGVEALIEGFAL
jgi:hypothetical protein